MIAGMVGFGGPRAQIAAIGGLSVLFVMATEQEFGENLKSRITPLMTGVGPVEAATTTSAALAILAYGKNLPDLVFTLGSTGSRKLNHAEIYQIASVSYRDIDASILGFPKGATRLLQVSPRFSIAASRSGLLRSGWAALSERSLAAATFLTTRFACSSPTSNWSSPHQGLGGGLRSALTLQLHEDCQHTCSGRWR